MNKKFFILLILILIAVFAAIIMITSVRERVSNGNEAKNVSNNTVTVNYNYEMYDEVVEQNNVNRNEISNKNVVNNTVSNNVVTNDSLVDEEKNVDMIYLKVNGRTLPVELEENSSVDGLIERLEKADVIVSMSDYSNFEKVGSLGFSLPRNDEYLSVDAGDIILYQGNQFVIYYDTNQYSFTKLGKVTGIEKEELKNILGSGNVIVTISLNR